MSPSRWKTRQCFGTTLSDQVIRWRKFHTFSHVGTKCIWLDHQEFDMLDFQFWSFFNSECEIVLTVYLRFTVIIFCYIIRRSKWETSIIIFYSRNHYLSIPKVHPILLILMEVPSGKLDKCTFYSFCKWWYIWSHHKLYCEMHAILHHSIRTVYNYPMMVVKSW